MTVVWNLKTRSGRAAGSFWERHARDLQRSLAEGTPPGGARSACGRCTDLPQGTDLHRGDTSPEPGRLFVAAHRLAQILALLNPRWGGGLTNPGVIARLLRRHPDALHGDVIETRYESLAFADLWNSYAAGLHLALRRTGPRLVPCPCSVAADAPTSCLAPPCWKSRAAGSTSGPTSTISSSR